MTRRTVLPVTILALLAVVSLGFVGSASTADLTVSQDAELAGCSPWLYNGCCNNGNGTESTRDCRYCVGGYCWDERETRCNSGGCVY